LSRSSSPMKSPAGRRRCRRRACMEIGCWAILEDGRDALDGELHFLRDLLRRGLAAELLQKLRLRGMSCP